MVNVFFGRNGAPVPFRFSDRPHARATITAVNSQPYGSQDPRKDTSGHHLLPQERKPHRKKKGDRGKPTERERGKGELGRTKPLPPMDRELEVANSKFAWLKLACAEDDLGSCATLLSELKVLLTKFPSMPPSFERTPNALAELRLARAIYEFAVIFSIKVNDQDAFERNFFQLKVFYMDTRGIIPPSPEEYRILGLNLMRLLADNRIAEFHTELELLPPRALDHPCIKYAVELEQSFMEGTYNRLTNGREAVPHETYLYFMDLLAETIRDEIADCSGQAYDHLPVDDAQKMLMFSSEQQLLEYISERQHEWEVQNCSVLFHMAKVQPRVGIQSLQLIKRSLCYARELERIV